MKTIDDYIENLSYYQTVVETQNDPGILKAELKDLISESTDFVIEMCKTLFEVGVIVE